MSPSENNLLPEEVNRGRKLSRALSTLFNFKTYLHLFRILHYYNYSHVGPVSKIKLGSGSSLAPNVSLRNGERIEIGDDCHIGERAYLWAGDKTGRIIIGNNVSLAPEVYITASDYRFEKGKPFRYQRKNERNVRIGNDVWLGVRVVVTAGVTIGNGCIIGAGAVVTKSIEANSIAAGVPAKVLKQRQ